jgi:hypothetical protein
MLYLLRLLCPRIPFLGDSHHDSHPVYSALTLVTPGRATTKRLSPLTYPGDTNPTTDRRQDTRAGNWLGI